MSTFYIPIDANGFGDFLQGGTAPGWYQLNTPTRTLTALPGVTVPLATTGVLIQARTDFDYCQSPSVAASVTVPMTLLAGGSMFIPGAEAVRALCIKLTSGASFVLQFFEGGIDPTLTID